MRLGIRPPVIRILTLSRGALVACGRGFLDWGIGTRKRETETLAHARVPEQGAPVTRHFWKVHPAATWLDKPERVHLVRVLSLGANRWERFSCNVVFHRNYLRL